MFVTTQRLYLAAATLALGGTVGFIVWLVMHNVRYTQRDLALKAAQLASSVAVRDDQVMELLMQYTHDATGQRLVLERAWAARAPVPHIRATTMDGGIEVVFVVDNDGFARRLETVGVLSGKQRHTLTARNAGLLMGERMRQVWRLLTRESSLSPAERLVPYSETWNVFLVDHPFPIKKRRLWRWPKLW